MSSILTTGSASLRTMAQQLLASERRPLDRLQAERMNLQARTRAWQGLGSRISTLLRLARSFSTGDSTNPLRQLAVSGHDGTSFDVTTGAGAGSGQHTIEVVQLASRHTMASNAVAAGVAAGAGLTDGGAAENNGVGSPAARLTGTARVRIRTGGDAFDVQVSVAKGASSQEALEALAASINAARGAVAATLLGSGSERRLLLQSAQAGEAGRIVAVEDLEGDWMRQLGLTGLAAAGRPAATTQEGADAVIRVNGVEIRGEENVFANVLPGVTVRLKAVSAPREIQVARDVDAAIRQVEAFLGEYNAVLSEVRLLTRAADEGGANRGVFAGDVAVTRLRTALRDAVTRPIESDAPLSRFSQIGITADREGKLSLSDPARLRDALEENPQAFDRLWSGNSGVAGRLAGVLDVYSRSGGIVMKHQDSARVRMRSIDERQAQISRQLARREEQIMAQLASIQASMGLLNQQKQYLGGLLASSDGLFL